MKTFPFLTALGLLAAVAGAVSAMDEPTLTIRLYGQTLPQDLDSLEKEVSTAWGQFTDDAFDEDALETDDNFRVGLDLVGTTPIDPAGLVSFIGAFGGSYSRQEFDITNPTYKAVTNLFYDLNLLAGNPNGVFFWDVMRQDKEINEVESYMAHLKLGLGIHPLPFLHFEALGFAGAGYVRNQTVYTAKRLPLWPVPYVWNIHQEEDGGNGYCYDYGLQAGLYFDLGPLQLGVHGGHLWGAQHMEAVPQTPGMTLSDYLTEAFLENETITTKIKGFYAGASVGLIF